MYLRAIYIFPWLVLFGISFFLCCVREIGSTAGVERRAGNCCQPLLGGSSLLCPLLRSCCWAESSHKWPTSKFPIRKITDHKWKQLTLVVNFLFGLRHLYWIPHRAFICSVGRSGLFVSYCILVETVIVNNGCKFSAKSLYAVISSEWSFQEK
jgi:hypothetical protein